jgi:hypothetical protein
MSNQDPPETVRLTLSPLDGRRLFGFLTELAEGGGSETDFSGLDELLDKIGDASAVALWLRENATSSSKGGKRPKYGKCWRRCRRRKALLRKPTKSCPPCRTSWRSTLPVGAA